jgi:hypothetical protein
MLGLLPKLTKDYILSNVGVSILHSEMKIFAEYLMLPESDISEALNRGSLFLSPLRKDLNPTCSFYLDNKNKLRMRDWAGYFWGDCFDAAAYKLILDSENQVEFNLILDDIARRFKIHKYASNTDLITHTDDSTIYHLQGKPPMVFSPTFREWNEDDVYYWKQYELELTDLNKFQIYPLYSLHINKKLSYLYSYQDPGYIYQTISREGVNNWECYFPKRDKTKLNKFLRNHSFMGLLNLIKDADFGLITKSRKDAASLNKFGINTVHTAAESTPPKDWELELIKSKWKDVYSLFDFDRQGVVMANKLRKKGVIPLFFTNGRFFTLNWNAKDFTDYIKKYKKNQTIELINYILDEGVELNRDFVEFYESLNH